MPLLFKAQAPQEVFDKIKEEYGEFLDSVKSTLKEEVKNMKDKFVIKKFDIGLEGLKEEIKKSQDCRNQQRDCRVHQENQRHIQTRRPSQGSPVPRRKKTEHQQRPVQTSRSGNRKHSTKQGNALNVHRA